ncbi:Luciferase-like monooxygenase [Amycolatopsis arida]|uniref:Luciferase-like monooxygenase n=1 Tax=Amycolatopsis arida TaxID=587909 RepID=A0A1I5Q9Z4_9PSEU|nr:LLM class flavin-dependent oxidoreductase [Amycolatopsis arida]TDX98761.1 luciferase-like monooxygenase [Amycolatopsis arida]SFP42850.1 Luciferase-like monooxygenase [Amycolatopsis arida]
MSGTGVRLGALVLPEHSGRTGAQVWRRVEELGFAHVWTLDHLSWRSLRDRPWFDAMITIATAACVTTTPALGVLVTTPNFRHPVLTARQAMSLDQSSEGRFVLGVGAGSGGPDSSALGEAEPSPAVRAARFGEFVTLVDRLLRDPVTTVAGTHFTAQDVRMIPGCLQRPRVPLAIAAAGPQGMRLAAEFGDFWVTIGDARAPGGQGEDSAFRTLRRQVDRLAQACDAVGRPVGSLRKLVNLSRVAPDPYGSPERLADLTGRCAALGFTDIVVAYPRGEGVFAGDLREFEDAVTHVVGSSDREGTY